MINTDKNKTKNKTRLMTLTAMMTAVTCVLAPFSIPIGTVPVSFTNFAIYLSLYILGCKMGTVSYIVYIMIGMVGLPVFSGFTGGIAKLAGPTGGYIIGLIPMALISGYFIEKYKNKFLHICAMIAGTIICYIFGTAWFCIVMDSSVAAALAICVFPFIPIDIVKIILASIVGNILKNTLIRVRTSNRTT